MSLRRGEVYFVNLNPVQGREQSGQRPVLIISNDSINQLSLVGTVIVETKGENIRQDYPTNVRIAAKDSGLSMETIFLCFQLRSLDSSRFPEKKAGVLTEPSMKLIENALRYCLGL
jgi:mRNA interferase MazF